MWAALVRTGTRLVGDPHADLRTALTDPAFQVPAVDTGPPGTLAWLRATVSRFSPPRRHAERRAVAVARWPGWTRTTCDTMRHG